MVVQAATATGMLTFASTVCDRLSSPASLVLRGPTSLKVVERRQTRRFRAMKGEMGSLDGEPALVLDVSTLGVCLVSSSRPALGELVVLGLAGSSGLHMGWVLDSTPDSWNGRPAYRVRVRLTEPLTHLPR